MNNYYTPDSIDEFTYGMTWEFNQMYYKSPTENVFRWEPRQYFDSEVNEFFDWYNVKQRFPEIDLSKVIRIKCLDAKDIESCGFIINEGNPNIIIADYKHTKEEVFFIVYDINTKEAIISIGKRLECGCPDTRFKGIILNIAELKIILKLIQ